MSDALLFWTALTAGNFLFQLMTNRNWRDAWWRSYYQLGALVFFVIFKAVRT